MVDPGLPTIDLLATAFANVSRRQVVDHVFRALTIGRGGWIVTPNLDYLRRCTQERDFGALVSRANLVVADGAPLVWAARLQGTPLVERVAGSDLVWLVAERAAREGRSLYLLGGNPGAAEGARDQLLARWPGLRVCGVSSPRVAEVPTPSQVDELREKLSSAGADIFYVAFGAPKQERWVEALHAHFPGTWWIGVGVSLSFMSGEIRRAPVWMQRAGLEWLHRLAQEPTRLARRYLLHDVPFAGRLLAHAALRRLRGAPEPAHITR